MARTKTDSKVRPDVLRQFYELSFGAPSPPAEAYAGATPSEYVRLYRIYYPHATARAALAASPRALGFRAKDPPDDIDDPPPSEKESWELVDKASVDLAAAVWQNRRVQFRRCILSSMGPTQLASVWAHECDATTSTDSIHAASRLRELRLTGCSRAAETLLLRTIQPEVLRVESDRAQFDLANVPVKALSDLDCRAAALVNPEALGSARMRSVTLVHLTDAAALQAALKASTTSLTYLCFSAASPVAPGDLPDLPSLRRIQLPAIPDHRDEWIEWATRHRDVACLFRDPSVFASMTGLALVGERLGLGIYADSAARHGGFVAFGPFIDMLKLRQTSYEQLEVAMKRVLRARRIVGVRVQSEADGLVMKAKSREALEKAIDACVEDVLATKR